MKEDTVYCGKTRKEMLEILFCTNCRKNRPKRTLRIPQRPFWMSLFIPPARPRQNR